MHDGSVLIDGSPDRPAGPISDGTHDIRLTLPASAENVVLVRHVVTALAETLGLAGHLVDDVRLAVTEACTNVVRHAYAGRHGQLEVRMRPGEPGALTVTVSDWGDGVHPSSGEDGPGLGLPLMAAVADSFEISGRPHGPGSRVRMSFQAAA